MSQEKKDESGEIKGVICTGRRRDIFHFTRQTYGVATISRLLEIIRLFYKRAL